ncbi:FAD-dependent monooxygenase [Pseudonocardia kujensis]|uniref:FAD-dependent monooxygenase n=1 Tax=Pseudonocardia kujensis TaxID=1128675 RepID=UPI001E2A0CB2|nr:FAD-dependent monooxygenase [Pseudonocardia kujensis]MCE0766840.1 FAD-dependent monooxygenase [Pseudonocardia kujensis]
MQTNRLIETDVLVVGAGPAGLATALAAVTHGARVLVVERRGTTSTIPRATGVSTRTMEIVREWGLTDAVLAGAIGDVPPRVAVAETLAGPVREHRDVGWPSRRDALRASPAHPLLCPQDHLEPVLVTELRRRGGEVRFDSALIDLAVTDGVEARLAGGERVRARFVVGADGPRSRVRAALGIGIRDLGTLGDYAQVLFRPDAPSGVDAIFARDPHVLWTLEHAEAAGVLLPVGGGRWCYARQRTADCTGAERMAAATPGWWRWLLRAATGLPHLEPRLLGTQTFTMAAAVATAVRSGPGFLVGDAAHRMTPVGGNGMNTAIHDGHELGWRLGWTVRGWAGPALLDSYAEEREPVGRARALRSLRPGGPDPIDGLTGDLGLAYRSCTVATDPADGDVHVGTGTARPGERLPHVRVRDELGRRAALDLLGPGFTLFTGAVDAHWRTAAAHLPVPVAVPAVGDRIARRCGLEPRSALLVRPDGVIAWRHDAAARETAGDHARALARAVGRAVGLEPAVASAA